MYVCPSHPWLGQGPEDTVRKTAGRLGGDGEVSACRGVGGPRGSGWQAMGLGASSTGKGRTGCWRQGPRLAIRASTSRWQRRCANEVEQDWTPTGMLPALLRFCHGYHAGDRWPGPGQSWPGAHPFPSRGTVAGRGRLCPMCSPTGSPILAHPLVGSPQPRSCGSSGRLGAAQ